MIRHESESHLQLRDMDIAGFFYERCFDKLVTASNNDIFSCPHCRLTFYTESYDSEWPAYNLTEALEEDNDDATPAARTAQATHTTPRRREVRRVRRWQRLAAAWAAVAFISPEFIFSTAVENRVTNGRKIARCARQTR